jgi:hypothetical protein
MEASPSHPYSIRPSVISLSLHIQSLIGNQQHQEAQAILQVKELKQFTVTSKWSQNEIKELVSREISISIKTKRRQGFCVEIGLEDESNSSRGITQSFEITPHRFRIFPTSSVIVSTG